jgi:hypothetical protein
MGRILCIFFIAAMLNSAKAASQLNLRRLTDTTGKKIIFNPLPQNFYKEHPGYFCKKELQLQKTISLPLFIRLGSKEYVDYLERKPNALKRN